MGPIVYAAGRRFARLALWGSVDLTVSGADHVPPGDGCILVCTHISHIEPAFVTGVLDRKVDWMAREEFFRFPPGGLLLRMVDAFPVNRIGVPVKAIRTAASRAQAGRMVGIFPEGGIVRGPEFMCRGGAMKRGAFLVQQLAQVPMVPCVVLGTHVLTRPKMWIPWRRARVQIAFGPAIPPPPPRPRGSQRREQRLEMTHALHAALAHLYAQICQAHQINDADVP